MKNERAKRQSDFAPPAMYFDKNVDYIHKSKRQHPTVCREEYKSHAPICKKKKMNSTEYSNRNINVVSGIQPMTLKPNGEYVSLTDIPLPSQEDNSETY